MSGHEGSATNSLRILMIAPQPFYEERGTPIAVGATAAALGRLGHRVHIVTFHEGRPWAAEGCTVERIPAVFPDREIRPGFSLRKIVRDVVLIRTCWRRVRRERFDLLHGVEEAGFIAWLIGRLCRIPFVYDMDSSMSSQLTSRWGWLRAAGPLMVSFERRMMRASVGILAACASLGGLARDMAPDAVHETVEDPSLLAEPVPTGPGSGGGGPGDGDGAGDVPVRWRTLVMYVGNLERYQGIDLLLEGVAIARRTDPGIGLVVIGGAPGHVAAYRAAAERLGCGDGVVFLGPRPIGALGSYLARADILAAPRITGTNTPMKVYSYMDAGRPILATDMASHHQVLDTEVALLVDLDPRAVADGLLRLAGDPALRASLGEAARTRYRALYGPGVFEDKLASFYRSVGARSIDATARTDGRGRPS